MQDGLFILGITDWILYQRSKCNVNKLEKNLIMILSCFRNIYGYLAEGAQGHSWSSLDKRQNYVTIMSYKLGKWVLFCETKKGSAVSVFVGSFFLFDGAAFAEPHLQ